MAIVIVLSLLAIALFTIVKRGHLSNDTLQTMANVAGVIALLAALIAFLYIPISSEKSQRATPSTFLTSAPSLTPQEFNTTTTTTTAVALQITPSPFPISTTKPFLEKNISISGTPYWQSFSVGVINGQTIEITYVGGVWCGGAGSCYDGQGAWFNRIQLGVNLDTRWASLVGRINASGTFYSFPIGNSYRFTSPYTGDLELRMNDDDGSSDNSGEIQILIRIWK
jgi:hypothetical protein